MLPFLGTTASESGLGGVPFKKTDKLSKRIMKTFRNTTKFSHLALALAFALCCLGIGARAQSNIGSIRGTITADDTDRYLDGATVTISGTAFRTRSDRSGRFSINKIPQGEYTLIVRYFGYESETRPLTVSSSAQTLEIELQSNDDEVFELETFNVKAGPTSAERAASLQRSASNRVDIVSSDSLGQLPDSTVADAVRRLPGINIEKDSQGRAGRYVSIRGMNADFNSVSINGQKVVVSNFDGASRSVPMDVVSADSAGTIEVTKSVLPSQDADSIGGSINIKSRSAFDKSRMSASVEYKVGSIDIADDYTGDYPYDETPYEFSASWSDILNGEKTLGLALSLNQSNRPHLFRSIENGPYVYIDDEADGFDDTEGFTEGYIPSYGRVEEAFDNVESTGGTARLDFRPNENFEWTLDLAYSERETNQGSQRIDTRYSTSDPEFILEADPVGDTAVRILADDRVRREARDYYEEQENTTVSTKFVHTKDDWTIDYGLGINQGDFAGDPDKDLRAFFQSDFGDNEYELQDGNAYNPSFGDRAGSLEDIDYSIREIRRGTRIIEDETLSGYFNAKKDILWKGKIPGYLKAGLKYTETERDFDDIRRRYQTTDIDWFLDGVFLDDEMLYGSVLADYGIDSALNGDSFGFMIDPNKIREAEEAIRQAGIRDEGDANWYLNQNVARDARADLINSYELSEQITAAYIEGQAQFEKLSLIGGVRIEQTDVTVDTHAGDFFEPVGTEFGPTPIQGKNDYTNVLPHFHLRYDANEDLIFRSSINQTLARASFRQLNPSSDIDSLNLVATKGNTALDPVVSTNLDFSVDRYFGDSRVSFSLFYKNMEDNIYRFTRFSNESDPSFFPEGTEVSEFLNADGAEVLGFEFAFDYELAELSEALAGFALSGNFTYTDSEVDGLARDDIGQTTQLFGQVPETINLALHFARWGIDTRLAWNYASDYLDFGGISEDRLLDDYIASRNRFDFSFRYRFAEQWTLFGEVRNLFEDDSRAFEGNEATRMVYREEVGRSAWLGVRWGL